MQRRERVFIIGIRKATLYIYTQEAERAIIKRSKFPALLFGFQIKQTERTSLRLYNIDSLYTKAEV